MASAALGAMFGGLEKFLQLRRGLQQDTQDRAMAKQIHDQRVRAGDQAYDLGDVQLQTGRFNLNRLPTVSAQGDLTWARNFGPQALQSALTENPTQAFGSGITAKNLLPGVQEQVRQQNLQTTGMELANKGTENANALSGIRLDSAQKVLSGEAGDSTKNPQALAIHQLAGVSGGPTFSQETDARMAAQKEHQRFTAGQNELDRTQRTDLAGMPPGMDTRSHGAIMQQVAMFEKQATQAYAELQQVRREIAENQTVIKQAQFAVGKGALDASAQAQAAVTAAQNRETELLRNIDNLGALHAESFEGMLGPEKAKYYTDMLQSIRMRAQVLPTATGGARPNPGGSAPGAGAPVVP